jgi:hypothetical protein
LPFSDDLPSWAVFRPCRKQASSSTFENPVRNHWLNTCFPSSPQQLLSGRTSWILHPSDHFTLLRVDEIKINNYPNIEAHGLVIFVKAVALNRYLSVFDRQSLFEIELPKPIATDQRSAGADRRHFGESERSQSANIVKRHRTCARMAIEVLVAHARKVFSLARGGPRCIPTGMLETAKDLRRGAAKPRDPGRTRTGAARRRPQ